MNTYHSALWSTFFNRRSLHARYKIYLNPYLWCCIHWYRRYLNPYLWCCINWYRRYLNPYLWCCINWYRIYLNRYLWFCINWDTISLVCGFAFRLACAQVAWHQLTQEGFSRSSCNNIALSPTVANTQWRSLSWQTTIGAWRDWDAAQLVRGEGYFAINCEAINCHPALLLNLAMVTVCFGGGWGPMSTRVWNPVDVRFDRYQLWSYQCH
jgi:hypothetical protein